MAGTILASATIDKVEAILQDTGNDTWSATTEHLVALNDGTREIAGLKPDVYTAIENISLVAGSKQSIPSDASQLIRLTDNMGADGVTRGAAITLVDEAVMSSVLSTWRSVTTTGAIAHYIYNPKKDPRVFWIYKGRPATPAWYVEAEVAKIPADIAIGAAVTLDDVYQGALMDFMLYRAWLKKKPATAAGYYNSMLQRLGLREQRTREEDPNLKAVAGGMPT